MTILWRLFNAAVFSGEGAAGGGAAASADATGAAAADSGASAAGDAAATGVKTTVIGDASKADATDTKAGDDTNKATTDKAGDPSKVDSKDGKAGDADKPIEYTDFALPDGVEVDKDVLGVAKGLFAESKLPQEVAQKYVDLYTAQITKLVDGQMKAWVDLNAKWVADFKADKELGGDREPTTMANISKALRKFGSPGLSDALKATGAGNHPEVIRFFARIGAATGESTHVPAGQGAGAAQASIAALYPTMTKE